MSISTAWLDAESVDVALPRLHEILVAVVEANASVGFMLPVDHTVIARYWYGVADAVKRAAKHVVVAYDADGHIIGTAQIENASSANGAHRAEVMKVLVHPRMQRHGVGLVLMHELEKFAQARGWWLLLLDTKQGDGGERLYAKAGWTKFGEVPEYAFSPDGTLAGTSFWYKLLAH